MSGFVPVSTEAELEAIYGKPGEASLLKVADRITPEYHAFLEASPFFAVATAGPEGLDCSPRGELGGAFRIHDEKTLIIPDRRGNNRMDSLRNIQLRFSSLKKSLPLSSMTMKAGKSSTSMRQIASMPSSGYSTTSTFLMQSWARRAAGPPIEPR
jgi:hypothetical protein